MYAQAVETMFVFFFFSKKRQAKYEATPLWRCMPYKKRTAGINHNTKLQTLGAAYQYCEHEIYTVVLEYRIAP